MKAKPDGMPWVAPYLAVSDAAKALEFYEKAFGFTKRFAMEGKDGKIMHAEMGFRDGVIMLGPSMEGYARTPKELGGRCVSFYVYVDDVDAFFVKAKAAGAKVLGEPKEEFWGDKGCRLEDPDGHYWMFATHVRDVAPEDMKPAE